jgi:hypothetical protein
MIFGIRLDAEVSVLTNGLIPRWLHSLMALLEVVTIRRRSLVVGSRSLDECPCDLYLALALSCIPFYLLLIYHKESSLSL